MEIRRRILMSKKKIQLTPININNYLTFTALEDEFYFTVNHKIEVCYNGNGDWKLLNPLMRSKILHRGETASIRYIFEGKYQNGLINSLIGKCTVSGNVLSIFYGDDAATNNIVNEGSSFEHLFSYTGDSIVSAKNLILPINTTSDCYEYMFAGCTSLTEVPELPAITLSDYCYSHMFYGCTSLVNAPELPATTLAKSCYISMFEGCTSLIEAPKLLATTLTNHCYQEMFRGCVNLLIAPELSANNLKSSCYDKMFYNCNNLNYIKMTATSVSEVNCLDEWVVNVANAGTFIKKSTTDLPVGVNGIPEGWTVKNEIWFTLDGVERYAIEGMTFGEWVESDYNPGIYNFDDYGMFNNGQAAAMGVWQDKIIEDGEIINCNEPF